MHCLPVLRRRLAVHFNHPSPPLLLRRSNNIGDTGAAALSHALARLTALQQLYL